MLTAGKFGGSVCITVPNFVPFGETVVKICPFCQFLKVVALRHIGSLEV